MPILRELKLQLSLIFFNRYEAETQNRLQNNGKGLLINYQIETKSAS